MEKIQNSKDTEISTLFKRIVINLRKKKLVVTEYNRDSIYKLAAEPIKSPFLGQDMKNLKKRGRPSDEPEKLPRCYDCHGTKKKDHVCNKEARLYNILDSCSPGSSEILASEVIKTKMESVQSKDIELKSKKGKPLQLTVTNCDHIGPITPSKPTIKSIVVLNVALLISTDY